TSAEFERFSRLTPYIASGLVLYKYETSVETGEWQEADILFPTETADGFWVTLQLRPRTAWTVEEDTDYIVVIGSRPWRLRLPSLAAHPPFSSVGLERFKVSIDKSVEDASAPWPFNFS